VVGKRCNADTNRKGSLVCRSSFWQNFTAAGKVRFHLDVLDAGARPGAERGPQPLAPQAIRAALLGQVFGQVARPLLIHALDVNAAKADGLGGMPHKFHPHVASVVARIATANDLQTAHHGLHTWYVGANARHD
jgi:hypothetical protein